MPNWTEILNEIIEAQEGGENMPLDTVRTKYLRKYAEYTNREVICYYSSWMQRPDQLRTLINDDDKNGFMNAICGLDKSKGLDLFLHTPGGEIAATESIVEYLRSIFGTDIRVVVPQIAMSAGTMIACSAREILMGKQSNLGPIDPQQGGVPAHGVIEEFETAIKEVQANPASFPIWQQVIAKYPPTFRGTCLKAISWSSDIVKEWLMSGMLLGKHDAEKEAQKITDFLGNHSLHKSHARHIHVDQLIDVGLKILKIEEDQALQDLVLSIHHCYMHTISSSPQLLKIIENHNNLKIIYNS